MKCEPRAGDIQITMSTSEACAIHNAIVAAKQLSISYEIQTPLVALQQAIDEALRGNATQVSPFSKMAVEITYGGKP